MEKSHPCYLYCRAHNETTCEGWGYCYTPIYGHMVLKTALCDDWGMLMRLWKKSDLQEIELVTAHTTSGHRSSFLLVRLNLSLIFGPRN